jgi:dCMP deaminase
MRPTTYETFAKIASVLAERSTCSSRAAVGAILFDDDNRIIATGYNGAPRGFPHCDEVGCKFGSDGRHCQSAIHAEENALLQCCVIGRSTSGLMLFTTHSPCYPCMLRLIQAGIKQVVYMQPYGNYVPEINWEFTRHHVMVSEYTGRKEGVPLTTTKDI